MVADGWSETRILAVYPVLTGGRRWSVIDGQDMRVRSLPRA